MFKPLHQQSLIGVISPAWIPVNERMEAGFKYLIQKGYRIKKGNNLSRINGYFAGTDQERINDLHDMFADPEVDLILCARGGWGGLRLVDKIDYDLITNNPKPLVGYSDITTIQLAIWKKTSVPSFSGPMLGVEMGKGILPFTEKHFWNQIRNEKSEYKYSLKNNGIQVKKKGKTEGILLGGCLSLVCHLLGTRYSPDYHKAILFIEDVGEKPYKIDRYLAHLKQAGVFDQISGLILGDFIDCEPEPGERSLTLDQIFDDYFAEVEFPVLTKFPYGHGDIKVTLPIGIRAYLDTEKSELLLTNPFYQ